MRRFILIVLLFTMLIGILSGCDSTQAKNNETTQQSEQNYPTEPIETQVYDPSLYRPQDRGECFIETENAYYYLNNKMVYVSQKAEPTFYYLCGKPDCSHSGSDCNAYGGYWLGYWNEKLYTIQYMDESMCACQMDLDGANHKVFAELECPIAANGTSGGAYGFSIQNGYLFYEIISDPCSFFMLDLRTGETTRLFEELLTGKQTAISTLFLQLVDGVLYFELEDRENPEEVKRSLYSFDMESRSIKKLLDWGEDSFTVENGKLCAYLREDGTFYSYDLATGTEDYPFKPDLGIGAAYYDTEYIYLKCWDWYDVSVNELYIFDREYQLLDHIHLKSGEDYLYRSEDKLFFCSMNNGKITGMIPASEIGNGKMEIQRLQDPYSIR